MTVSRLLRDSSGSAAAEMALVTPLLLILLFGSVELGNYFLSEHVLVKSVRDGAVYAARLPMEKYDCAGGTVSADAVDNTKALVRTGQISGGTDRLPNWTHAGTTFSVTVTCVTAAGGTNLGGIYTLNGGQVPVVTVSASVKYQPVLASIGFDSENLQLNAAQEAAVAGI